MSNKHVLGFRLLSRFTHFFRKIFWTGEQTPQTFSLFGCMNHHHHYHYNHDHHPPPHHHTCHHFHHCLHHHDQHHPLWGAGAIPAHSCLGQVRLWQGGRWEQVSNNHVDDADDDDDSDGDDDDDRMVMTIVMVMMTMIMMMTLMIITWQGGGPLRRQLFGWARSGHEDLPGALIIIIVTIISHE